MSIPTSDHTAEEGTRRSWRVRLTLIGALVAVAASAITAVVVLSHGIPPQTSEFRVVAYKHDDGAIEFGLQYAAPARDWGETILPDARFIDARSPEERWLVSSSVLVDVVPWPMYEEGAKTAPALGCTIPTQRLDHALHRWASPARMARGKASG